MFYLKKKKKYIGVFSHSNKASQKYGTIEILNGFAKKKTILNYHSWVSQSLIGPT